MSSSCVIYDGEYNDVLKEEDFPCEVSIEDVIVKLSESIDVIQKSIDLSQFNKECLTFNRSTQSHKDLWQEHTTKLCQLQTTLTQLQTLLTQTRAGDIRMILNLGCLQNGVTTCDAPLTYTLKSVLELFAAEICLLKS